MSNTSETKSTILNTLGISRMQAIKWLLWLGILVIMLLIPISETFTVQIRNYLLVTVLGILLVAFDIVPILAAALLIPAGYMVLGVCGAAQALSGYTNQNFYMAFGAILFTFTCIETGILNRISLWIVIKVGKGSYNRTLYAMLLAGTILGIVTINAQQMVMIALAIGIISALKREKIDMAAAMLMNTAQMSYLTVRLALYFPLQHALLASGGVTVDPNFTINWIDPIIYGWIFIPATFVLIFLYTKIFKTSQYSFGGGLDYLESEYKSLGKMSAKEKKGLVYLSLVMILVATGSITNISTANVFMTLPFIAFLPGLNLATEKTLAKLPWGTLLLTAACLAFGNVGTALGLGDILNNLMAPFLQSGNAFMFLGTVFIISTVLNFILTPLAIITMFAVPVAQMAASIGIDPMAAASTLYFSVEAIFMPHESTGYLLLFSFGMMTMNDFIKLQSIKSIWIFIVFMVIVIPYWMVTGLLYI